MGFISHILGTNSNDQYQNTVDPNQLDQSVLGRQNSFADALQNQMNGTGPSVAGQMLNQNNQQNQQAMMGMAASQRGVNPGLALRSAMQAGSMANQQNAQSAALARAQEQLGAMGQLGGHLNAMQNQSIQSHLGAAGLNAGMANQSASNNAGVVGGILGGAGAAMAMSTGGLIQGQPQVSGDSPSNDTVPAMLSPGEIVVPRSQADHPEKAKAFIDELMSAKGKGKKEGGYGKVLEAHRKMESAMAELKKHLVKA